MKTMKKALYAVCLAAAILLSLGSCSSNENQYVDNFSQALAALDWGEGTTTYVIGHKSPDTDAVCSAITYAYRQREMVFTMVLNKTANYTDIIYCGEGAKEAAEAAFGPSDSDYIRCEGQLSRKNDFIPALSKVLQP